MAEPGPAEREYLLAQPRELSGFLPAVARAEMPSQDSSGEPDPKRLGTLELRRLHPHVERLAVFKAEQGRLPSAGPAVPPGSSRWRRGCGDSANP